MLRWDTDGMGQFTSRVELSGRVMIPAALRNKLGLNPGVTVLIDEENGVVRLQTQATAVRKVRGEATGWLV